SNTEPGRVKGWLNLKGRYVDIGNAKDAFYQYAKKEDLIFNLSLGEDTTIPFHYAYEMEKDVLPPKADKNIYGETRSEEHTSELQSREKLVCRLLLEKKNSKCD